MQKGQFGVIYATARDLNIEDILMQAPTCGEHRQLLKGGCNVPGIALATVWKDAACGEGHLRIAALAKQAGALAMAPCPDLGQLDAHSTAAPRFQEPPAETTDMKVLFRSQQQTYT